MPLTADQVVSVLVVAVPVLLAEGGRWLRHRQRQRATRVEDLREQLAALEARVEDLEQLRRWAP